MSVARSPPRSGRRRPQAPSREQTPRWRRAGVVEGVRLSQGSRTSPEAPTARSNVDRVPDHPASPEELLQFDDVELVRRAQAPAATEAERETARRCIAVVRLRHSGTIRAVIAAKVPSGAVDDLESDVSVRFCATVHRGRDIANPAGLLVRIAQRVRADHLDGRRPTATLDGWEYGIDDPDLEAAANEQAVEELLAPLSQRQREVVWLRIVEGRSGDEVAAMLNTSRGNIDVILHRALRRLQEEGAT